MATKQWVKVRSNPPIINSGDKIPLFQLSNGAQSDTDAAGSVAHVKRSKKRPSANSLAELVCFTSNVANALTRREVAKSGKREPLSASMNRPNPGGVSSAQALKEWAASRSQRFRLADFINYTLQQPWNRDVLNRVARDVPKFFSGGRTLPVTAILNAVGQAYRHPVSFRGLKWMQSFRWGITMTARLPDVGKPPGVVLPRRAREVAPGVRDASTIITKVPGLTMAYDIVIANMSREPRQLYSLSLLDLPNGPHTVNAHETATVPPGTPPLITDPENISGNVGDVEMGKTVFGMCWAHYSTPQDPHGMTLDLVRTDLQQLRIPARTCAYPALGVSHVQLQREMAPGSVLRVRLLCNAIVDTHMRKMVLAALKLPPKGHTGGKVKFSEQPLYVENCAALMLEAVTAPREPNLYTITPDNLEIKVHPDVVASVAQAGMLGESYAAAAAALPAAAAGGGAKSSKKGKKGKKGKGTALPPGAAPARAAANPLPQSKAAKSGGRPAAGSATVRNLLGQGKAALNQGDMWEGGNIKDVHWALPDLAVPLPPKEWTPPAEALALVRYEPIHEFQRLSVTGIVERQTQAYPVRKLVPDDVLTAAQYPFSKGVVSAHELFPANYRTRMHNLIAMEYMQQALDLRSFDTVSEVTRVVSIPGKAPGEQVMEGPNQLFISVPLSPDQQQLVRAGGAEQRPSLIMRDQARVRLMRSVTTDAAGVTKGTPGDIVYEGIVETMSPEAVIIRLERLPELVRAFPVPKAGTTSGSSQVASVRFVPASGSERAKHLSIDAVNVQRLFPNQNSVQYNLWNPRAQFTRAALLDKQLDDDQLAVVKNILEPCMSRVPSVVLGPFGCGKTRTLMEVVAQLVMRQKRTGQRVRILIATQAHVSADLYVKQFANFMNPDELLRLYPSERNKDTVPPVCLPFTYQDRHGNFATPPADVFMSKTVVISTIVSSSMLLCAGLSVPPVQHSKAALLLKQRGDGVEDGIDPSGRFFSYNSCVAGVSGNCFSHILVDEAAQASEPDVLGALALAGPDTKIVLVGDHKQIGPEVKSSTARRLGLERSILERLHALSAYKPSAQHHAVALARQAQQAHGAAAQGQFPPLLSDCRRLLSNNYRSHNQLTNFTSQLFYGTAVVPKASDITVPAWPLSNLQRKPQDRGALVFIPCTENAVQNPMNSSWQNAQEVQEIAKTVITLLRSASQGGANLKPGQIRIVAAYRQQVVSLRRYFRSLQKEMREQAQEVLPLGQITISHARDVQGVETDVMIISTVRSFTDVLSEAHEAKRSNPLGDPDDSDEELTSYEATDPTAEADLMELFAQPPRAGEDERAVRSRARQRALKDAEHAARLAHAPPALGLFRNPRTFNTCITRARAMVIAVGDPALLVYDRCWRHFIKCAVASNTVHSSGALPGNAQSAAQMWSMLNSSVLQRRGVSATGGLQQQLAQLRAAAQRQDAADAAQADAMVYDDSVDAVESGVADALDAYQDASSEEEVERETEALAQAAAAAAISESPQVAAVTTEVQPSSALELGAAAGMEDEFDAFGGFGDAMPLPSVKDVLQPSSSSSQPMVGGDASMQSAVYHPFMSLTQQLNQQYRMYQTQQQSVQAMHSSTDQHYKQAQDNINQCLQSRNPATGELSPAVQHMLMQQQNSLQRIAQRRAQLEAQHDALGNKMQDVLMRMQSMAMSQHQMLQGAMAAQSGMHAFSQGMAGAGASMPPPLPAGLQSSAGPPAPPLPTSMSAPAPAPAAKLALEAIKLSTGELQWALSLPEQVHGGKSLTDGFWSTSRITQYVQSGQWRTDWNAPGVEWQHFPYLRASLAVTPTTGAQQLQQTPPTYLSTLFPEAVKAAVESEGRTLTAGGSTLFASLPQAFAQQVSV